MVIVLQVLSVAEAQSGRRFPAETRVVVDPITGVSLRFLASTPTGDRKIYPTHPQWTADGKWIIFRSNRILGQAMAVNEETGDLVQVTETGYQGTLCVGQKSMRLFLTRPALDQGDSFKVSEHAARRTLLQVVAVDLAHLFADSAVGRMKSAADYEHVFGTIPSGIGDGHELAIDATEKRAYFRLQSEAARKFLPEGTTIEGNFGPGNRGAGPSGIASRPCSPRTTAR